MSVQDAAAQLAAPLLGVQPGMRVLDACAAPGGKTGHLLECAPDLDLTALDQDAARLERVRENLTRLGLKARLVAGDARQPADWWDGVPYDRILLDAPCSATGVIRRHPDIKLLRRESDIAALAGQQQAPPRQPVAVAATRRPVAVRHLLGAAPGKRAGGRGLSRHPSGCLRAADHGGLGPLLAVRSPDSARRSRHGRFLLRRCCASRPIPRVGT